MKNKVWESLNAVWTVLIMFLNGILLVCFRTLGYRENIFVERGIPQEDETKAQERQM